ncbi:MAG: hypothetical protein H0U73_04760 [Tatlockia sp.]|nr:hypothetical protein [Tatlockia sp.]
MQVTKILHQLLDHVIHKTRIKSLIPVFQARQSIFKDSSSLQIDVFNGAVKRALFYYRAKLQAFVILKNPKKKTSTLLIKVRSETVTNKPAFRQSFKSQRCLVHNFIYFIDI